MVSIADAIEAGELLIHVSALGCGYANLTTWTPGLTFYVAGLSYAGASCAKGADAAWSIHYLYEIFVAEEGLAELLRLDPQPTQHSTAQP